jgi:hypothetical protein
LVQFTKNGVTAYKDPKLPAPLAVSEADDWADHAAGIPAADLQTLVAVIRTLYPHQGLPETVYRRVALRFARLAAGEAKAAAMIAAFCARLGAAWPIGFAELAETYRVQALKTLEGTPEFVFVQRLSVKYLYDDIEVWAEFGYEGASAHLGGYVTRGFNDLDWLPPLPNDL